MSVRTVAAAGTSFLLREHGEGPGVPVLLLHGVPETSSCWSDLAPQLATGRRVLAPDLPGLGGSSYGGPYDVPSLVAQLVALVEAEVSGPAGTAGATLVLDTGATSTTLNRSLLRAVGYDPDAGGPDNLLSGSRSDERLEGGSGRP